MGTEKRGRRRRRRRVGSRRRRWINKDVSGEYGG
jgi:hypothetical protein